MLSEVGFDFIYTSGKNEPADFFLQALMNSLKFDLGLGFFHSSGFRALSMGFAYFIYKGGSMRFIINDSLSDEDKRAIQEGLVKSPDEIIEKNLIDSIMNLSKTLSSYEKHFFNCISWLISTQKLTIKAFTPTGERGGIVHQKFGLFSDNSNNKIVFSGSANFSKSALTHNLETIECHPSWTSDDSDKKRIKYYEEYFNEIWNGKFTKIREISIDKIKIAIKNNFEVQRVEDLIEEERSSIKNSDLSKKVKKLYEIKIQEIIQKNVITETRSYHKPELSLPVKLRTYQIDAVKSWFENNCIGLYEMATGTGKTITALAAALELIKKEKNKILLITCPYIHLVEQWNEEAIKFGFRPITVAEASSKWVDVLARELQLFQRNSIDLMTIITTNVSMTMNKFQSLMTDSWKNVIFIADECHYLGSSNIRKFLPAETLFRLGLSATPQRYYDDEGTNDIYSFFNKVVYSLPLEDAIGKFLTPYYYYPIPLEMTADEFEEYCKLTKKMQSISHFKDGKSQDLLEKIAIQRARIQNNSITKLEWVRNNIENNKNLFYTLFYAGDKIFDEVKRILGYEKRIKIHEFTGEQNRKQRKELLDRFSRKELQALIAMKCLDEGVDIPPTRTAYFLASSGNPREFIQRRGRVLRKSDGKDYATLYDLIAIPPIERINNFNESDETAVKAAFRKEFKRIREFSKLAINKNSSFEKIFDIAVKLDLLGE